MLWSVQGALILIRKSLWKSFIHSVCDFKLFLFVLFLKCKIPKKFQILPHMAAANFSVILFHNDFSLSKQKHPALIKALLYHLPDTSDWVRLNLIDSKSDWKPSCSQWLVRMENLMRFLHQIKTKWRKLLFVSYFNSIRDPITLTDMYEYIIDVSFIIIFATKYCW